MSEEKKDMQSHSAPHTLPPLLTAPQKAPELLVPEKPVTERGLGEAQRVSLSANPRLRIFAFFINIIVVCEVFVAMYFASLDPDRLTPVFFKVFFALLVPTLVGAYLGRRLIGKAEQ